MVTDGLMPPNTFDPRETIKTKCLQPTQLKHNCFYLILSIMGLEIIMFSLQTPFFPQNLRPPPNPYPHLWSKILSSFSAKIHSHLVVSLSCSGYVFELQIGEKVCISVSIGQPINPPTLMPKCFLSFPHYLLKYPCNSSSKSSIWFYLTPCVFDLLKS